MPARHYRVEYTEDDTNYTLLAADEAPGKGQAHPVTGLSAGTHTGKLRLTPLNGDAPVASLPFTFTLGSVPVSEPVQSIAAASATVADVLTMRDNLMAAIGVTAAPADTMAASDQLTVAATVQATAADLKVFSEQLLAAATSDASVATVQAMAEQLLVAVAGTPSVLDVQRGTIVESLVTSITVDSTAASVQTMAEQLVAAASPVATIADVKAILETVLAAATATATVTDTYTPSGPSGFTENFETRTTNSLLTSFGWTGGGATVSTALIVSGTKSALLSVDIDGASSDYIEIAVTSGGGNLTFNWRGSNDITGAFYVDGVLKASSVPPTKTAVSVTIAAGTHTLKWSASTGGVGAMAFDDIVVP